MQLRTPGHLERAALFLLVGGFVLIEATAIRSDRANIDRRQEQDRKDTETRFKTLLDSEKKAFSELFTNLIDHEDSNMKQILKEQREDFKAMLSNANETRRQQSSQFKSLLDQQESLFQHQEELAESLSGKLVPGHSADPLTDPCGEPAPSGSVKLLWGSCASIVSRFPHTIMHVGKYGDVLSFDRSMNGTLTINLDIRDNDGKLIVRLDESGFAVNRNNFLEMKHDPSHLKVIDEYGDTVLEVVYLNYYAIRVDGTINLPGYGRIVIGHGSIERDCSRDGGIEISIEP
jgi:hypothetical protein